MYWYYRYRTRIIIGISLLCFLETLFHVRSLRVSRPSSPLDLPFHTQCQEPKVRGARENAVIMMLARNSEAKSAAASVASLEKQFNRWFHYPMVFLNDVPWDQGFIDALTAVASGEVSFEVIPKDLWNYPDWIDREKATASGAAQQAKGLLYAGMESYHHMCRFNSGQFYHHPALKKYKWYWRVDSDVEYTCAITYDPFVEMARNDKKYGYTMALWERGDTAPTLFRKVSDYKKARGIRSTNTWKAMIDPMWLPAPFRSFLSLLRGHDAAGDGWNYCHYWSNFEIADLDFFRSDEFGDFFDMLDKSGGFYFERWGDAPVHSLAAALFLEPRQIHYFEDFGYVHDGLQHCPKNALGGQLPISEAIGEGKWDREEKGGIGCRCECNPTARALNPECQQILERAVR